VLTATIGGRRGPAVCLKRVADGVWPHQAGYHLASLVEQSDRKCVLAAHHGADLLLAWPAAIKNKWEIERKRFVTDVRLGWIDTSEAHSRYVHRFGGSVRDSGHRVPRFGSA
jgi:hypothetical protein